jgi:hypothetical protein
VNVDCELAWLIQLLGGLDSIVWKQTQHTARALDPSVSLILVACVPSFLATSFLMELHPQCFSYSKPNLHIRAPFNEWEPGRPVAIGDQPRSFQVKSSQVKSSQDGPSAISIDSRPPLLASGAHSIGFRMVVFFFGTDLTFNFHCSRVDL